MQALELEQVTKRFGAVPAVQELSFGVAPGEIFGFLGPNGAGKTTTLRMVLDILQPDSGRIAVFGAKPGPPSRRRTGFLPEERGLYRRMTALATIIYFARLKGASREAARRAAGEMLERFGLTPLADRRIEALSKGQAQKVQLAAALAGAPPLLLLDEPFSGLDPIHQGVLETLIRERAAAGAAIVFSTHVMAQAERLCSRLLLIARGRAMFEGTVQAARARLPGRVTLLAREAPHALPGIAAAESTAAEDGWTRWDLTLQPGASAADLLQACFERGYVLRGFERRDPALHDIFVTLLAAA